MHIVPKVLLGLLAVLGLAWGHAVAQTGWQGALPWVVRQEVLNLSGVWSLALMSLATLLAARPRWLEKPFGGLGGMYRAHRWAAVWAGVFAGVHWFAKEIAGSWLASAIGKEGKVSREKFDGIWGSLQHLAKDMGEWAFYLLLLMLLLSLWRRFPRRPWRYLHRLMPLLYLALVFHALLLAPTAWWRAPFGALLGLCLLAGCYGALLSLSGRIRR